MRTRVVVTAVATAFATGAAATALLAGPASTTADAGSTSVDAMLAAAETETGPAADEPMGKKHKRLLTQEQRQQLRSTGHIVITKDTKKRGTITVAVQLGEVTAVSPTSITLKSKDGYTHSYSITDKTKVRVRRQPAAVADLAVGAKAAVIALVTPAGDNARRIVLRPAGTASRPGVGEPTATKA